MYLHTYSDYFHRSLCRVLVLCKEQKLATSTSGKQH